jgi:hypothetical protein
MRLMQSGGWAVRSVAMDAGHNTSRTVLCTRARRPAREYSGVVSGYLRGSDFAVKGKGIQTVSNYQNRGQAVVQDRPGHYSAAYNRA